MVYQKLQQGDLVDVIAPSYGREVGMHLVEQQIRDFGFVPRIPSDMLVVNADPFCANNDEARFEQLKTAIYAEDSKIIWAFRGGYGATRLIPRLLELPVPAQPKILIGYSDITALHIVLIQKFGWSTIHGRTISEYVARDTDIEEVMMMKQLLCSDIPVVFSSLVPLNQVAKIQRIVKSEVIGGNICLIQNSLGTDWQLQTKDKIILLEDIEERGYRIDRMLVQLTQAGIFKEAKAVIIGDIICAKERDGSELCDQAVSRFAQQLNIPVLSCPQIGHGPYNMPVPMNMPAVLHLGESPTLEIEVFGGG